MHFNNPKPRISEHDAKSQNRSSKQKAHGSLIHKLPISIPKTHKISKIPTACNNLIWSFTTFTLSSSNSSIMMHFRIIRSKHQSISTRGPKFMHLKFIQANSSKLHFRLTINSQGDNSTLEQQSNNPKAQEINKITKHDHNSTISPIKIEIGLSATVHSKQFLEIPDQQCKFTKMMQ